MLSACFGESACIRTDWGRDPGIEVRTVAFAKRQSAENTFERVARAWFALHENRWTPVHAKDVTPSLNKDVVPWIGWFPVTKIDEPVILAVLRKTERRSAIETAHQIRQRMSAVFIHAIAGGLVPRDPAVTVGRLSTVLRSIGTWRISVLASHMPSS